ncbi:PAS domain S-box protein [Phenylobacterium sp. LjRoot225]|uniref:sensor histidine kinase n=1 Tax=Phenylobacterium sp. LjRoot225 TaxID=3342285 RepID=UPI003ED1637E
MGPPVGKLDIATVVRASQAISGQIERGKLVETLITVAVPIGGADRGLLILLADGVERIEAEARMIGGEVAAVDCEAPIAEALLPISLMREVVRTGEHVLLHDTLRPNPYSADPYLRAEPPRSILCLPLLKQAKVAGVLYLENVLAAHAFAPDRIDALKLLAAQAVISLENARLYSELQEREARIRRLFESNIIGIYFFDWTAKARIRAANDAVLKILGCTQQDLESGKVSWDDLTPPEYRASDEQAVASLRATGSCGPYEREIIRKDGVRVPVLIGGAFFEGARHEGVAFVLDLTERKEAELRQKILVDELNHRVKNTLATVQSVCAQTLRSAASPEAFQEEFNDRLWALSQTHNVLNQRGWQGAGLREILETVLAPHRRAVDMPFDIRGGDVRLGPASAVALGMAFHELATNALKYGALSTPSGRVSVAFGVAASEQLQIVWQEFGGPAVQTPGRRGFGSRLIERSLPAQLHGEVHLDFLPQGLRCEINASLAEICRI